ncbi:hypothetical protein KAR91_17385 [Candidatus Pacearchaeota archaeon]|nr:hypothetical protein [Candidatus Pacearchaeota archaeon]
MKALEAVGRYEKIRLPKTPEFVHAELNGYGVLTWVEKGGIVTGPVSLRNQIRCDWEPVDSKVRPKAGETWRSSFMPVKVCFIVRCQDDNGTLMRIWPDGSSSTVTEDMFECDNWSRVKDNTQAIDDLIRQNAELSKIVEHNIFKAAFADVERDSKIDRVIVNNVGWIKHYCPEYGCTIYPDWGDISWEEWEALLDKGKCRMILEFKK